MLELESRRSSIELVAEILRLGEASKVEIMYNVNLSHRQLRRYIRLLSEQALLNRVITDKGLVRYRVTPKGSDLLKDVDTVLEMLRIK